MDLDMLLARVFGNCIENSLDIAARINVTQGMDARFICGTV
ncbi:hypothetical protein MGWOODY_Clf2624 [hydrothermal vent metagenome]|uniref:Uncharacterized protein n=1 Tax=hydrothermal vent metagenome TaxID=652676 RepID=A0A170Q9G6_9ZZZZ